MTDQDDFIITPFHNVHDNPHPPISFQSLLEKLNCVDTLTPVVEVTQELKEICTPAFTLCSFSEDEAKQDNIKSIAGISLDFDDGHASFETISSMLVQEGIECHIHTTAKHRESYPRLRAIIPYKHPLRGDKAKSLHKRTWEYFNHLVGPIDPAGKNPSQKWLFPKYGIEGEPFFSEHLEHEKRFNPLEDLPPEPDEIQPPISKSVQGSKSTLAQSGNTKELTEILQCIDPSCEYSEWFETIAASINAFGRSVETIDTLDQWSQQCEEKYSQEAFNKAVESVRDDHTNKAGIGKLRYLAGLSTRPPTKNDIEERVTIDRLEEIVPSSLHSLATDLATDAYKHTEQLLLKYGNDPDEKQLKAIWSICEGLSYTSLAQSPIRVAYALATGMAKTTSFRGVVHSIHNNEQDISVLYCAERIQDLADLKNELIKEDNIPSKEIGLLHSSHAKYPDIESIDPKEADSYKYLLLAHGRVQHQFTNPNGYLYYKGKKRNIAVWDEAFYSAKGDAINTDKIRQDIAAWQEGYQAVTERDQSKASQPSYEYMVEYLEAAKNLLTSSKLDQEITLPVFDTSSYDYERPLKAILGKNRIGTLEKLIQYGGAKGKQIIAKSNKSFIQFDVVIPDEVDKIVVLDASAEINLLQQYDSSLKLGDIGDVKKDYRNVTVNYCPVQSSRDYLSSIFSGSSKTNVYLKELGHIVQAYIPEGEEFIVFTHKDRDGINYRSQILDYLGTLGLGYRDRCHVITWGNERGTNRYAHVKYAITVGVNYRDASEIGASIIGQNRDLSYEVDNREIKRVSDSLQADALYQGISRGNMRVVKKGLAGQMTCWIFHKEKESIEILKQEMHNANFRKYIPAYLSEYGVSDAVLDFSQKIIGYLNIAPPNVQKISNRSIAKALNCPKTNSRTWQDAIKRASDDQYEWEKPKGAQSFYRGNELELYLQQKKLRTPTRRDNRCKTFSLCSI